MFNLVKLHSRFRSLPKHSCCSVSKSNHRYKKIYLWSNVVHPSKSMQQESSPSLDLTDLKEGLLISYLQSSERGLMYSANWAVELANSIETDKVVSIPQISHSEDFVADFSTFSIGKSLFDLKEYRRATHWLKNCKSDEAFFLKCYCLYLAGEKEKEDSIVDALGPEDLASIQNTELVSIRKELTIRAADKQLDGFGYYLFGVIYKEMHLPIEARKMFLRSVHLTPLLWASWFELAKLCESREMLYSLDLPNHWLRDFFYADASLVLLLTEDALSYYTNLSMVGFSQSSYINAQLALVNYHLKNFPEASLLFEGLRKTDPYRLTDLDTYSNVLFVLERLPELSMLAQDVVKIDKYRSETCSVLGNFYGLRGDHDMAIVYFRRAVRLNKNDHSAWILLGHEYLEQTNCSMAIEAYSRGLEANKHDFRGYYGLGHTYEVLRMSYFALYYYKQAHRLRPSDPRILEALGTCYIELNQNSEAKKCLTRAIAFKELEGTALIKLAKLHAKLSENEEAAKLYTRFVATAATSELGTHLPEEEGPAHLFLAKYHLKAGTYSEAEAHAHKSTEFVATREEGKSLLQEVVKLKKVHESTGKGGDLGLYHLDDELSPIPANPKVPEAMSN